MSILLRLFIGAFKVAALVWIFVIARRYFGTAVVIAEVGRRLAGLFGWNRGYALLTAVKKVRRSPRPAAEHA